MNTTPAQDILKENLMKNLYEKLPIDMKNISDHEALSEMLSTRDHFIG